MKPDRTIILVVHGQVDPLSDTGQPLLEAHGHGTLVHHVGAPWDMRGIKQHNTHLLYHPKNHRHVLQVCVCSDGREHKETRGQSVIQAQFLRLLLRVKWFSLLQRLLTGKSPSVPLILLPTWKTTWGKNTVWNFKDDVPPFCLWTAFRF